MCPCRAETGACLGEDDQTSAAARSTCSDHRADRRHDRTALARLRNRGSEERPELVGQAIGLALSMDPVMASNLTPASLTALLQLGEVDNRVMALLQQALDIEATAYGDLRRRWPPRCCDATKRRRSGRCWTQRCGREQVPDGPAHIFGALSPLASHWEPTLDHGRGGSADHSALVGSEQPGGCHINRATAPRIEGQHILGPCRSGSGPCAWCLGHGEVSAQVSIRHSWCELRHRSARVGGVVPDSVH